ncbi:TetR/AcrR family transcriptional regulator [Stutzerimonas stutzeri]|uniref:TetR/AcrR family transcriptional regulator n=1 Tax=Stutzerimonas sp. S1 TaxID=3030652 RepID=UPI002224863A|nr:TetR/AcrR family transcriptional regulator [Stutzerimonas sp. S1]MCW3149179.1 TetR/AcrR family transcriptional regulator [Stutzerimonas sp. S1]
MIDIHSPSPGPGRPKDPAKREAILAAAQVLFLGNGYEGSSMDAIAAEAGVSKLTLYSHFKDKEALFCAAVKATCETRLPRRLFQLEEDCAIETLLLAIGNAFNELVNSPESIGLHRAMIALATHNPALVRMFFEAGPQQLLADLEQLFAQASSRGLLQITEPRRAAEHFCSLIKGARHFRQLIAYDDITDSTTPTEHVRDAVGVFLRAYGR